MQQQLISANSVSKIPVIHVYGRTPTRKKKGYLAAVDEQGRKWHYIGKDGQGFRLTGFTVRLEQMVERVRAYGEISPLFWRIAGTTQRFQH